MGERWKHVAFGFMVRWNAGLICVLAWGRHKEFLWFCFEIVEVDDDIIRVVGKFIIIRWCKIKAMKVLQGEAMLGYILEFQADDYFCICKILQL